MADFSCSQSLVCAAATVDMIEGWSDRSARPDDLLLAADITAHQAAIGGRYRRVQGPIFIACHDAAWAVRKSADTSS